MNKRNGPLCRKYADESKYVQLRRFFIKATKSISLPAHAVVQIYRESSEKSCTYLYEE